MVVGEITLERREVVEVGVEPLLLLLLLVNFLCLPCGAGTDADGGVSVVERLWVLLLLLLVRLLRNMLSIRLLLC